MYHAKPLKGRPQRESLWEQNSEALCLISRWWLVVVTSSICPTQESVAMEHHASSPHINCSDNTSLRPGETSLARTNSMVLPIYLNLWKAIAWPPGDKAKQLLHHDDYVVTTNLRLENGVWWTLLTKSKIWYNTREPFTNSHKGK